MLVGVCDAAVVLFLVRIFAKVGIRISHLPEMLDELLALFIGSEFQKGSALVRCDDVRNIAIQPVAIIETKFLGDFRFLPLRLRPRLLIAAGGGNVAGRACLLAFGGWEEKATCGY